MRRPAVTAAALAVAGGAATSLAFAPAGLVPFAVVGPALGLWAFRRAGSMRRGVLAGTLYGLAFTSLTFQWMLALDLIAYVVLSLLPSVFWAIIGGTTAWMTRLRPGWWVAGTAAVWTLAELVRARFPVIGFVWGQLGLATSDTVVRRAAATVGALGVSGLLVAVAAGLVLIAARRTWASALPAGVAVGLLAVATGLGSLPWTTPGRTLQVATVQTNVPCEGEFAADCPDYSDELLGMYVDGTAELTTSPDLLLWGEDALLGGETLDAVGQRLVAHAGTLPAPLLAGSATPAAPGRFFRWAALFDRDGTALGGYAKRRPVPFGEYVPLRSVLGGISDVGRLVPSDMMAGEDASPVVVPVDGGTVALGTVVSWEVTFSRLVRDVGQRADGLATLTTVSSYGRTSASDQLLATAQLRAAEQQKPMVVAATTGRSAMILPSGELASRTALLQRDTMTAAMPLRAGLTPFARAGDLPVAVVAAAVLLVAVVLARRNGRDRRAVDPTAAADVQAARTETDDTADSAVR